jgi:Clathrin light chain
MADFDDEDDNAFAAPPLGYSSEYTEDATIVLAPADDYINEDHMLGFAAPPAEEFVGTVDESSPVIEIAPPKGETAADLDAAMDLMPSTIVSIEPSPMAKFNETWQQTLLERKDEENTKKAEYLTSSEEALKNFANQREQKRENKMKANRADEQEKLEAIEADLENDNSWQKVCKMVELNLESHTESADVKRMRDVMIVLKNDTQKATLLA